MKTLATYSIKGGVGKTTSAVNLAYEAARSGARVLLWDLDPQGAATFFFRVKPVVKGGVERPPGRPGVVGRETLGELGPLGGAALVEAGAELPDREHRVRRGAGPVQLT